MQGHGRLGYGNDQVARRSRRCRNVRRRLVRIVFLTTFPERFGLNDFSQSNTGVWFAAYIPFWMYYLWS